MSSVGRIGPYTLLATVADGGMARVYLAQHRESGRICVLKQLHQELEEHVTAALRFRREAAIASKVDHPNVARVLDAGFHYGRFFIALEFVAGQTLEHLMKASPLHPDVAVAIISSVLEGLGSAHAVRNDEGQKLGIVHRDITPRNVMVGYQGDVKIIDFGIARAQIDAFRTSPGVVIGTLGYMAPEQALTLALDGRSDLYSTGVILYEALTGHTVLPVDDARDRLRRIILESPPPLRRLRPDLSPGLEAVLLKAMSKMPADRYQTADEFRDALLAAWPAPATKQGIGEFVCIHFSREQRESRWLMGALEDVEHPTLDALDKTIEQQIEELESVGWSFAETSPGADIFENVPARAIVPRTPPPTAIQNERAFAELIRTMPAGWDLTVSLDAIPLDEVLLLLHEARFTGAVEIGDRAHADRVMFRSGAMVGTSRAPALEAQLLKKRLLELKMVTAEDLDLFPLGLKNPDADLIAAYLVERGLIDEKQLRRARTEQAVHRMFGFYDVVGNLARVREGLEQLFDFSPRFIDIRPVIAFGLVIRSGRRRRKAAAERFVGRRIRMIAPYDDRRNFFWLPSRVMEALRPLSQDWLELGDPPLLPKLDDMTSLGVLLLLERLSLLEVAGSKIRGPIDGLGRG